MESIEIIKNELITQKTELESRGFAVPIKNRNPSPTEITNAIKNINVDFTSTTATEADVALGKTFFSQTNEIRTGTLNTEGLNSASDEFVSLISGVGQVNITLPSNITRIREYAFYTTSNDSPTLFHAEDLDIPEGVTFIGTRSLNRIQMTGKITIPSTCTSMGTYAFCYTTAVEVEIKGSMPSNATYMFEYCKQLERAKIGAQTKYIPNYLFNSCSALKHVTIAAKATMQTSLFNNCTSLQTITFENQTPPSMASGLLKKLTTVILLVPYDCYDTYFNATNYQEYSNPMYGFGNFIANRNLPESSGDYTIVWYASLEDLQANTNPITITSTDGIYYGVFTPVASEEDEGSST